MADTSDTSANVAPNYEEMFAHRFTTEDREYQEYLSRPTNLPPVVEDWRGRGGGYSRGRDNRYQDQRGRDRGRGWGGGWGGDRNRGWGGEHRDQQQHYQDRDRRWGQGSGHQSGYNQRPQYDRY